MRHVLLLGSGLCLSACSFSACGATPTPPPSVEPVTAGATYELHEWGLLRGGPGDVLEVGTTAPALDVMPMAVEKPVLYFHVTGDAPIDLARASVEAVDGTIREHWPLAAPPVGEADPARVSWAPLTLRTETCPFIGPTDRSAACGALPLDEECESLSLLRTVVSDAACVDTASGPSPILFYRSTSRGLTVPLTVSHLDFGDLTVTNDSDHPIPGSIVRFITGTYGLRVIVAPPPLPHETALIGHEDVGVEGGRAAITRTMLELGMTESEAQAFLASWEGELFTPSEVVAEEVELTPTEHTTLLYFLPPALTARVSRLDFEPAPTATRRALAVWTAVP